MLIELQVYAKRDYGELYVADPQSVSSGRCLRQVMNNQEYSNDFYSLSQQLGVWGVLLKRPLASHLGELKSWKGV